MLTPRLSGLLLGLFATAVGLCILALLVWGSYTRRATVVGQIQPSAGIIRVQTPQNGVVLQKKVAEGQLVEKGQVLYVLSSDRTGLASRDLQADISSQVTNRIGSLQAELGKAQGAEQQELANLRRRTETLRAEAQAIGRQTEQQRQRVAVAQDTQKRYKGLADQDYIAREQLIQKELELSEQQSRLGVLQREALSNQRELAATERDIDTTRTRYTSQVALLQRSQSSAKQELTEIEARSTVVITAAQNGRATFVTAEVGQVVDPSRPLLSLVPENAVLEAKLYAPSRTMGFVRAGNRVLLRYQAFPYQKFGQHEGVVKAVSGVAAPPSEIAGLAAPELAAGEPLYAITVALKSQNLQVYGEPKPLQAGMRLDADILQETRKLYEWMLDPIYSITGKMER